MASLDALAVPGLGAARKARLVAAGFDTVEALAAADPATTKVQAIPPALLAKAIEAARAQAPSKPAAKKPAALKPAAKKPAAAKPAPKKAAAKPAPKKAAAKPAPKKAAAKPAPKRAATKPAPDKAEPKKAEPKKAEPKKAEPKKSDSKKSDSKKSDSKKKPGAGRRKRGNKVAKRIDVFLERLDAARKQAKKVAGARTRTAARDEIKRLWRTLREVSEAASMKGVARDAHDSLLEQLEELDQALHDFGKGKNKPTKSAARQLSKAVRRVRKQIS